MLLLPLKTMPLHSEGRQNWCPQHNPVERGWRRQEEVLTVPMTFQLQWTLLTLVLGLVFYTSIESRRHFVSSDTVVMYGSDLRGRENWEDVNTTSAPPGFTETDRFWISTGSGIGGVCNKFTRSLADLKSHQMTSELHMENIYIVP